MMKMEAIIFFPYLMRIAASHLARDNVHSLLIVFV